MPRSPLRTAPNALIVFALAAASLAALALAGGAAPDAAAQELMKPEKLTPPDGPHPFGPTDLWAMHRLSNPMPSPDGRWVCYEELWCDVAANKKYSNLWLVSIDGKTTRRLTSAQAKDTEPDWSPDGRWIAFTSSRGDKSQIWVIEPAGGEARQLTDLPVDVSGPLWSPKGDAIAFTAEVYPDAADLAATAKRDKALEDDPVGARRYDTLMFRHWDTWDSGRRNHVLVARVADGTMAGDPIDIMKGSEIESPVAPFGDRGDYAWSPDGRSIAFCGKERKDAALRTDNDIYLAAADGSGFHCVTEANEATDAHPVFSPDGKTLAYLAMSRPGYESDKQTLALLDVASGKTRLLTQAWDASPEEIAWSADGRTIFTTAEENGRKPVFAIDASKGTVRKLVAEHKQGSVAVVGGSGGGRLVFLRETMTRPAEVYTAKKDGSDVRALTRVNEPLLAGVGLSQPEEFWFEGAAGDRVHGWILKPVGFQEGKKYPVAFLIHGGPQGSWQDGFHYRWNPQIYAGAGYATITVDFHGSTGYGQAFCDAIRQDWGGKPYEDLMKGLDYALANYSWLDGTRTAALGASYGGYMIFWIAGHTDRFKCLVAHDGSFDEVSAYYGTEELWFPEWDLGGTPWTNREVYEKWSAERYVKNWKTPMLVIHGSKDYRLPETEGFAAFTALQRLGVPSRFLWFPDENHWVLKPLNALVWHETVLGWLDTWVGNGAGGAGMTRRDEPAAKK